MSRTAPLLASMKTVTLPIFGEPLAAAPPGPGSWPLWYVIIHASTGGFLPPLRANRTCTTAGLVPPVGLECSAIWSALDCEMAVEPFARATCTPRLVGMPSTVAGLGSAVWVVCVAGFV